MNKKIGITLDFVIRDYINRLKEVYVKKYDLDPLGIISLDELYKAFPLPKVQNIEADVIGEDGLYEAIQVVDDGEEKFETDEEAFDQFLNTDYTIEIYGHCKESVNNAMFHVNSLAKQLKVLGHDLILISEDTGKARPSTLFFLSKTSCELNTIMFLKPEDEYLNYFDIMITANEKFAKGLEKNIKIHTEFNEDFLCEESYTSVKDINLTNILK